MASLLPPNRSGEAFTWANTKDTVLDHPMGYPAVFPDSLLPAPTTTNPLDLFLSNPPSSQNINPYAAQFSFDGAPPLQYPPGPSPTDPQGLGQYGWDGPLPHHHHHTPTSNEDDQYYQTTTASKSPSPTTQKKRTGRKPGRRPSQQHDEQREKFLEKNRIAANKHRKRKKEFVQSLESRYDAQLSLKNSLKEEVSRLRGEALDLQEALFFHAECNNAPIQDYLNKKINGMSGGKGAKNGNRLGGSYII